MVVQGGDVIPRQAADCILHSRAQFDRKRGQQKDATTKLVAFDQCVMHQMCRN